MNGKKICIYIAVFLLLGDFHYSLKSVYTVGV